MKSAAEIVMACSSESQNGLGPCIAIVVDTLTSLFCLFPYDLFNDICTSNIVDCSDE
jgi:hypothetical protein